MKAVRSEPCSCQKCGGPALLLHYKGKGKRKGQIRKARHCPRCAKKTYRGRKLYLRHWHRLKKYGLNRQQVEAMAEKQGWCCAVCRAPFTEEPHVDHDHKTKMVRGLLCRGCNTGIGQMKNDPHRLRAAADYLDRPYQAAA